MNAEDHREPLEMRAQYERIQALVDKGILSRELCPEPGYWRWAILKPDELPEEFRRFIPFGEVRWLCQSSMTEPCAIWLLRHALSRLSVVNNKACQVTSSSMLWHAPEYPSHGYLWRSYDESTGSTSSTRQRPPTRPP